MPQGSDLGGTGGSKFNFSEIQPNLIGMFNSTLLGVPAPWGPGEEQKRSNHLILITKSISTKMEITASSLYYFGVVISMRQCTAFL